jgi:hypothetical protein
MIESMARVALDSILILLGLLASLGISLALVFRPNGQPLFPQLSPPRESRE